MEQIIGKLSEIETTAEIIMKDALQKKKVPPLEVTNPSLLRISAISCRVCSSFTNVRSMATALLLLGLLSAFSLQVLILF